MATCSKCNGKGWITCPECGGDGGIFCICSDWGSVHCPQCRGTEQVENDKFTGGSSSAPSSSGGSSSYSAPPPPKPVPQPQSPKYPQDIEIILSKNIKSEDELWKLAVYFESIGDYKKAAHWYDVQIESLPGINFSKSMLKIAEYYAKGYSIWSYDLIKDRLKDAIGRDSGRFVDELKKCLKEFKKRK